MTLNNKLLAQALSEAVEQTATPEYRFHPTRKWRFDYAWPIFKVALEVEGGVWTGGRHTRGAGYIKDLEKYNTATRLGWRVLRVQPKDLLTLATAEMVKLTIRLAE